MKLAHMSIKKTKKYPKLLTVANLTADEVGADIGVWIRTEQVHDTQVQLFIVRKDNGDYMVTDTSHLIFIDTVGSLQEAVSAYNAYVTNLGTHDIVFHGGQAISTRTSEGKA